MIKRAVAALIGVLLLVLVLRMLMNVWAEFDPILFSLFLVPAFTVAGLCLWYAVSAGNPQSEQRIACGLKVALVVGLIAFGIFFVGPAVVMPEANQGPLLGLFAAPLGFALGAILGICFPGLCHRVKSWGT